MWESAVITNSGKELLEQWANGGSLVIDAAAAGQGTVNEAYLMGQTALVSQRQTLSIIRKDNVENGVRIQLQCTNQGISEEYTVNQIGIWAHLDNGANVLLALFQDTTGVLVPTNASMPDFVFTFYAVLQISNEAEIEVTVDTSAFVTTGTLQQKAEELSAEIEAEKESRQTEDGKLSERIDDIVEGTTQVGNAANSDAADKLNTDAGSATKPVYVADGVPVQCGNTLDMNISGTAARATNDAKGNQITAYYGHSIKFTVDPQTYVLTAQLLNATGEVLATQSVDLPLESVVVSGSYDDETREVVLTLQNGSEVKFSVADLVDGLATQAALDAEISARKSADSALNDKIENIVAGTTQVGNAANSDAADKLNTDAGSATKPVYVANGIPVQCGNTLDANITGNAASATNAKSASKATNDGSGNEITSFYAHNLTFSMNNSNYVLTAKLLNAAGETLATQSVDLPLESVVVSGSYDDETREVVLTLQNGSEVKFSVADLVDGLATQAALDEEISNRTAADTNLRNQINDIKNGVTAVGKSTAVLRTVYTARSNGVTTLEDTYSPSVYRLAASSHLYWPDYQYSLVDTSTLAFWTGAYTQNNNSNLRYCAYGTIVGTETDQTIGGTKTFSKAPKISAPLSQDLNDTTAVTANWVRTLLGGSSGLSPHIYTLNVTSSGEGGTLLGISFTNDLDTFIIIGGAFSEDGGNVYGVIAGCLYKNGNSYSGSITGYEIANMYNLSTSSYNITAETIEELG